MRATGISLSTGPARAPLQRLLADLSWYGAAEIAGRLFRIATTIVLARQLDSTALGVAAIALTLFELIRVVANNGLGQAVIRAPDARLQATCATAQRLAWGLCLTLAAIQAGLGLAMTILGLAGEAGAMLACLALVYLVMAPGLVPVYLILRERRMQVTARIAVAQVIADTLLTIALVLAGFGAWGVVLPKLLVAPIWLIAVRRARPWRADPAAGRVPARELLGFAAPVLGCEMLTAARLNLDNLLVGAILGVDALGVYFFVFNAGIGFSLALTNTLSTVLFPHLAAVREDPAALRLAFERALRGVVPAIAALIALQAAAALVYVPIVFGARWQDAAGLVAILCASAVSRPFADAASQALRVAGVAARELRWAAAGTAAYLGAFAAALPFGLATAVTVLAIVATLLQTGFVLAARRVLRKGSPA